MEKILSREELKGLVATGKNLDNVILKAGSGIKPCPFCGQSECKEEVYEFDGADTWCIRCEYCGVIFIMDGEDFNKRETPCNPD